MKGDLDLTSPTTFNTLSNAYAAAIELASPNAAQPPTAREPKTAINTAKPTNRPTSLRLVTNAAMQETFTFPSQRTQTPGPFAVVYPDTPTVWSATTTPVTAHPDFRRIDTPIFTFTPPQSAHPTDEPTTEMFSFSPKAAENEPTTPRTLRRRATTGSNYHAAPYTHPRSLHSILRNSPLPPRAISSPRTPTRASQRIAERKKVCYNNPLTQTITNNKYIKSHIDLLAEEASPYSATDPELETLDLTLAYTGDETRDGGQTPGPFEEMRRRMAGLGAESDNETPGNPKKRKRKEKRRQWVWTIGKNDEDDESREQTPLTALRNDLLTAVPLTAVPMTAVRDEPLTALRDEPMTALRDEPMTAFRDKVPQILLPTVFEPLTEDVEMTDRPESVHSV